MENNIGKAYAHKSGNRQGDMYHTPKSLIWVSKDIIRKEFTEEAILEPCCGSGAISEELEKYGYSVLKNDLYTHDGVNMCTNFNYLNQMWTFEKYIITNPPFTLWDEFVMKAKTHCEKFMFIGRLNYQSTQGRYNKCLWKNLKGVYPFTRYIDYQTPYRIDGKFHVGAMATAWFLWDMNYEGDTWEQKILDVSGYGTLGQYMRKCPKCGTMNKPANGNTDSDRWFCLPCDIEY
jgi:hypothetical protein